MRKTTIMRKRPNARFAIPSSRVARRYCIFATLAASICGMQAREANAQTFPTRTIEIVVPFPAGGSADVLTRVMAKQMSEILKQPIVVSNVAGANGAVGTERIARQPPDGYILGAATSSHPTLPFLVETFKADPVKDFTSICLYGDGPVIALVNPTLPIQNIADLIAYAKANPGKASIGNSEAATMLTGELFKMMAGVDLQQVAYKGGAPLMTDVVGGHIPVAVTSVTTVMPHYKSQKLRVLGVSSKTRSSAMPDVPTISEAGVPGYEVQGWYALLGPKGLPPAIAERLQKEIAKIVSAPEMHERFETLGAEAAPTTPSETAATMKADMEKWAGVIKKAGIQPQ